MHTHSRFLTAPLLLLALSTCDKPPAPVPSSTTTTPPQNSPVLPADNAIPQPATPPTRSPALSREPIDGRVPSTGAPSQPPISNSPTNNPASGQTLTRTLPTNENVSVFKDNQWLPARIRQRDGNRALIEFDNRPASENQWVTPDRVRPR